MAKFTPVSVLSIVAVVLCGGNTSAAEQQSGRRSQRASNVEYSPVIEYELPPSDLPALMREVTVVVHGTIASRSQPTASPTRPNVTYVERHYLVTLNEIVKDDPSQAIKTLSISVRQPGGSAISQGREIVSAMVGPLLEPGTEVVLLLAKGPTDDTYVLKYGENSILPVDKTTRRIALPRALQTSPQLKNVKSVAERDFLQLLRDAKEGK